MEHSPDNVQTLVLWLLNIANVVYVFCYGVRDVLWLRILAVTAMLLIIPYYIWGGTLQLHCICWQAVFIAINVGWIIYIIRQRRPPKMTDDQKRIYQNVFSGSCTPKDMLQLLSVAEWKTAGDNTKLISKGQEPNRLILIDQGTAKVNADGEELATLGSTDFVAEMSFLTNCKAVADVVSDGTIRYLSWSREALDDLFEQHIQLRSAIHELIGRDLVRKITATQTDTISSTIMQPKVDETNPYQAPSS